MTDRPHVILLMADHLRADCLSCYGDLGVRTPRLDELASQSVIFDRAYCSTPLCVPTRTSLATGKWPHTTGVIVNGGRFEREIPWRTLGPGHRTYYEQFADAGCPITHVGIQHVHSVPELAQRVPQADVNRGQSPYEAMREAGALLPEALEWRRPVPEWHNGRPVVRMSYSPMYIQPLDTDPHLFPDIFWTDRMVQKIEEADPSVPRFWVFQLWAPHPPYWVPRRYAEMYDPASIQLPADVGRWSEHQPAHYLHGSPSQGSQFMRDDWRRTWAAYFGLTTLVDDCMGRVIDAFRKKGIWNDALAVFVQDHGENLGGHGCFQKFTMHEASARLPLLVKPPGGAGGESGTRRSQPVGHVDIAPTFCDYASLPPMEGAWGSSLRRLVADPAASWRDATFCEYNGDHGRGYPTRAMMTDRYKYACHFAGGPDEMYDVVSDPLEERNLASLPEHRERGAAMRTRIGQWMRETGDVLDLDADADFNPFMWSRYERPMPVG
jgi:arylsulfatase A-like enzyme